MNKDTTQTQTTGRRGFWRRLLALGAAALGGSFLSARAQPAETQSRTMKIENTEYTFDAQGRVIQMIFHDGAESCVNTYEYRKGRLSRKVEQRGSDSFVSTYEYG